MAAIALRGRLTLARRGLPVLQAAPGIGVGVIIALLLVIPVGAFLVLAFAPALFGQPGGWFDVTQSFGSALQGGVLTGIIDSIVVSALTAVVSLVIGLWIAWFLTRSTLFGARWWPFLVWAVLMAPSYLMALGWQSLLGQGGTFWDLGLKVPAVTNLFFAPPGVLLVYVLKGVPFAYLAVSWAMGALGGEFEDAARIHGAGRWRTWQVLLPMIAPAMWSAMAIVFAETISDFGIAHTLAAASNLPLATQVMYNFLDDFPTQFSPAAAVSWFVIAAAGAALLLQSRALRGRVYGSLSGRTRQPARTRLSGRGQLLGLTLVGGYFLLALGVPILGAVVGSLLNSSGPGHSTWTLSWYQGLFQGRYAVEDSESLPGPLSFSTINALIAATAVAVIAIPLAMYLTRPRAGVTARMVDLVLLGTVALPGIVLGAGYIFTYNLPFLSNIGLVLYQTTPLLAMAYIAGALPNATRVMMGPVAQVDQAPVRAARVHGASPVGALRHSLVPVVSRSLLWAWIYVFTGVLFELPVSQLLYPPNTPTLSVMINRLLGDVFYGPATTMSVASIIFALLVVALVLGAFRILAPRGWRQVGSVR
jgi:iron(III) transport system permease protein